MQPESLPVLEESRRGPRGPYKKVSRTTDWRNRRHASDIRKFFEVNKVSKNSKNNDSNIHTHIVIDDESDVEEIGQTNTGGAQHSFHQEMWSEDNPASSKIQNPNSHTHIAIDGGPPESDAKEVGQMDLGAQRLIRRQASGNNLEPPHGFRSNESLAQAWDTGPSEAQEADNNVPASTSVFAEIRTRSTDKPTCAQVPLTETDPTSAPDDSCAAEEYLEALNMLQESMDRLKICLPNDRNSSEEAKSAVEIAGCLVMDPELEEGPTPQDVAADEDDAILLLDVEGRMEGSRFYTTLSQHLTRLLEEARKSKTPSIKSILELTVISDYNILRETLRKEGCRSPGTTASEEIARVKSFDPLKGMVKTKKDQLARRIRTKAMHVLNYGCLPGSKQGKGATHHMLLCREDVQQGIAAYLRSQRVGQVSD